MTTDVWRERWSWIVVALWVITPFTTGEIIAEASNDHASAIRAVEITGAWLVWAVTLTASLIRRPVTLTMLRLGTSAGAVAAVIYAFMGDDLPALRTSAALFVPFAAWLTAMGATVGASFVDGASYGDEKRFPLRVPAMLLAGPVPLAWAVVLGGACAGPLLLAARQWVTGSLVTVAGMGAAVVSARALHGLARRWVVFVPAGVVVHDTMTAREPFLMIRNTVSSFGPAPRGESLDGDDLIDATQGAAGIVLLITLRKAVEVVPRPRRGEPAQLRHVNRVAIVATRPGAVVAEAHRRRIV